MLFLSLLFCLFGLLLIIVLLSHGINLIRTGVISLTSRQTVINRLCSSDCAAYFKAHQHLVDLGSGSGKTLARLCQHYQLKGTGYETNLAAYWQAKLFNRSVQYRNQSFYQASFDDVDIIYCFLMQDIMPKVATRIIPKLKPGTLLISNAFPLPATFTPERTIEDTQHPLNNIYFYKIG